RVAVSDRAAQLEQRTAFLNSMLAGHASATQLSQQLPQSVTNPANPRAAELLQGFDRVDAMQTAMADRVQAMTRQRYNEAAGALGPPGYATADGVVDRSEWNNGGYGNLIELDHGQGIQTRYGHLSQRLVQPGQRIHRGQLIGLMGSTGRSTGSHLHYEVRIDGRAVNPIPFLQQPATTMAALQQPAATAVGGPATGSR